MTKRAKKPELYVFSVDSVRKSIAELRKIKTHEHVPGYLALLRSQKKRGGSPSQLGDIVELYDRYLKVLNADGHPYLRPFLSRGTNIWFNDNVAGSYAPSNVKADPGPFFRVVDVAGSGLNTTYSLPADHASRASQHLLNGHRLPIAALTAFMYRDYGLKLDTPTVASAVAVFRNEFSLRAGDNDQESVFQALFYDDTHAFPDKALELLRG